MIEAANLAASFEEIIGWPYDSPGTNDQRGIDCSGAFVRAYKKHGKTIAHGSNTIFRKHCSETGQIAGDVSRLVVGMAVFKRRDDGGEPDKYKGDGNGNLYHIGLVTKASPLRIVHATTPCAKADTTLGQWSYYGRLSDVSYGNINIGIEVGKVAGLTGKNCKVTGGALNLREKKDKGSTRLCQIPEGVKVLCLADEGTWSKARYEGADNATGRSGIYTGYCLTEYLQEVDVDAPEDGQDAQWDTSSASGEITAIDRIRALEMAVFGVVKG